MLEAWLASVPVVVNATCDPTREHCERSGGGLWFGSYREFEAVLDRLLADAELRGALGGGGGPTWTSTSSGPCSSGGTPASSTAVVERGRGCPGVL